MIDPATLAAVVAELGEPPYRVHQVMEALTRGLSTSFAEMTSLPTALRRALATCLTPLSLQPVETRTAARGGARKTLFVAADGLPVETVLLPRGGKASVCVSTQVGCAVGCAFCASGRLGLRRDLTAEEMVDQVLHFARELRGVGRRVDSVVLMGMGEPFHNYAESLRACRTLNDKAGFALAARAISVSTVGVVPGIDRFAAEPEQFNLAVSLHAAGDEVRDRLVPLNRTYPLEAVLGACRRYVRRTRRKVLFEYVVLHGVNDTEEQVCLLARRMKAPGHHLNLIPYNETGGGFVRPSAAHLALLRARLRAAGVECTVRRSPGGDIEAACGQLALRQGVAPPHGV